MTSDLGLCKGGSEWQMGDREAAAESVSRSSAARSLTIALFSSS